MSHASFLFKMSADGKIFGIICLFQTHFLDLRQKSSSSKRIRKCFGSCSSATCLRHYQARKNPTCAVFTPAFLFDMFRTEYITCAPEQLTQITLTNPCMSLLNIAVIFPAVGFWDQLCRLCTLKSTSVVLKLLLVWEAQQFCGFKSLHLTLAV